jgi:DNA-binding MarR family transcriptional regulator
MDATPATSTPHPETIPGPGAPGAHGLPAGLTVTEVSLLLEKVLAANDDARAAMAARLGRSLTELSAMQHLMGEPIGTNELGRRLHMTSASATALADRLEAAGHVQREPHPTDGRRRVLRPTPGGVAVVLGEVAPLVADLVAAEEGLDEAERAAVTKYLARVSDALRRHA